MARRKGKKSSDAGGTVVAEFGHKDAKGGGGRNPRVPAGDYVAKILSASKKEAKESGNQMIVWKLKIAEGKYKGKEFTARTVLIPSALFMLRHLLEALGEEVPEKTVKVKYAKYIGKKVGITIEDGEYNNKPTSEVNDFIDPDMVGEDDEDDEDLDDDDIEDDDDDDDEDSDEDDDGLDDLSRKELKEHIAEEDLDVRVKKSMDEDDIRDAIRAAEGDDDDDDDDMDEVDLDEL